MLKKIFLQGEDGQYVKELKGLLEASTPYPVLGTTDKSFTIDSLHKELYHLLVLERRIFDGSECDYVKFLRGKGFGYPIIILANSVTVPSIYDQQEDLRLHFLPFPLIEKDLIGVTKKLMHHKIIPQQVHRRYLTNQRARMEPVKGGSTISTNMYNLSKGGAYCEYEGNLSASNGDMLKFQVQLKDVHKAHSMAAQVVWSTRKGHVSGKRGIGLRFLNEDSLRQGGR